MSDFLKYIKNMGFDVKKYDALKDCSDYELLLQLRAREKKNEWIKNLYSEDPFAQSLSDKGAIDELSKMLGTHSNVDILSFLDPDNLPKRGSLRAIIDGVFYGFLFQEPLKTQHFEKYFHQYEKEYMARKNKAFHESSIPNTLPYTDNVSPISRWDLECFINGIAVGGAGSGEKVMPTLEEIDAMDSNEPDKLYLLSSESLNCVVNQDDLRGDFKYGMFLKLDLNKSDDEIVKDLNVLLPIWRKELGLNVPEKKREWNYIKRRVIEYRIIPLLDVLALARIFTFVTGRRVQKRIIALLVYPDGERDGFGLDQTVLPFLEKVMGSSSKLIFDYKITK
ncbi:DUF6387 family protein [Klebsiella pneumoniae]|uniref:DUF6387 family protein n=1 Tax=Klebsiella pneumoniae TaxID=573 RepID=UPI000DE75526|nr:DUF6387 family protein [Klebsiella pneumoniae]SSH11815.1 Uncharacterised protein [Klebsiella pneumoniae]